MNIFCSKCGDFTPALYRKETSGVKQGYYKAVAYCKKCRKDYTPIPREIVEGDKKLLVLAQWQSLVSKHKKPGRNSLCFCKSGKKFKQCCITMWEYSENNKIII